MMKCRESAYRLQFSRVMDVLVFRLQQRGQDVHVIVLQHVSDHSDQHCASANCCCYKQCQTNFAKSAHCKRIHRMSVQVQAKVRSVQASTRRPVVLICSFNFQPTVFLSVWLLTFFDAMWHWVRPNSVLSGIGADSTGATGTFAPVLSKVLGREYGFAPVLFEPSKNWNITSYKIEWST